MKKYEITFEDKPTSWGNKPRIGRVQADEKGLEMTLKKIELFGLKLIEVKEV